MKTLIVDKENSELRYQGINLTVYSEGKRINTISLNQLERVVVSPHVVISAGVLGVIAEKNVSLMVLNARFPQRTASLSTTAHGDSKRRLKQYQLVLNPVLCLQYAVVLVGLKVNHQQQTLKKALKIRADLRQPLMKSLSQLNEILHSLHNGKVTALDVLCGLEGAAAAIYFKAYTQLFSASLDCTDRNRRPPRDPVNSVLSLAYTLLHQEAVNALKIKGLDPALGFYHQVCYGRDSLACDLIEPTRAYLDEWIWRWFAEQKLRAEHFTVSAEGCFLTDAGKAVFYKLFFWQIKPLKRLLRYYAQNVATVVQQVK
jgi:CRISPR-associated protein Cas1